MRTSWTFRLAAVILLVLCSGGVFGACDGDCQSDDLGSCQGLCCHPSFLAGVQSACIEFSPNSAGLATDQVAYMARYAVADVFRPPNSLLSI